MRWSSGTADRAHRAFDIAMRAVVDRLGLTYQAPSSAPDFPGATGTHRGHRIAFFIVSETDSPMMTGLVVRFDNTLSMEMLARLKARKRILRRAKLEVRTSARSGEALPRPVAELLDALNPTQRHLRGRDNAGSARTHSPGARLQLFQLRHADRPRAPAGDRRQRARSRGGLGACRALIPIHAAMSADICEKFM